MNFRDQGLVSVIRVNIDLINGLGVLFILLIQILSKFSWLFPTAAGRSLYAMCL